MASGSEEIRVPIALPVTTNADQASQTVDQLAQKIRQSESAFADASKAMRGLKGTSDEVKAAKDQLRTVLDREKQSISASTLALYQQGTSLGALDRAAKAAAKGGIKAQTDGVTASDSALRLVGGPLSAMKDKLDALSKVAGGSGAVLGIVTLGVAALAAGVAYATKALVGGIVSLGQWIAETANASRQQQLLREAVTTSADDAQRLGDHVDQLALKVPKSKDAINAMAVELRRSGIQGQTLVDTLNAVAQASAGLGDTAGDKVKELIERGRQSQRFSLNRQELQGTGINFEDVAGALAKQTGQGIDAARQALARGRVSLGAGAAALRKALEDKLGGINLEKTLSLDNIGETFKTLTSGLVSGINLKPLTSGLGAIFSLFGTGTQEGVAMKDLITKIGNGAIEAFAKAVPAIQRFIDNMIIGALKLQIFFLKARNTISDAIAGSSLLQKLVTWQNAIDAVKVTLAVFATAAIAFLGVMAVETLITVGPWLLLGAAIVGLVVAAKELWDYFAGTDWDYLGHALTDGIVNGIKSGWTAVKDAVSGLAGDVKNVFTGHMGINSPSKVFEQYGQFTAEGYAQGIDGGTGDVEAAAQRMGDAASPGAGAGQGGGGGGGRGLGAAGAGGRAGGGAINVVINIDASGAGPQQMMQLRDPSLMAPFLKNFEQVLLQMGYAANA